MAHSRRKPSKLEREITDRVITNYIRLQKCSSEEEFQELQNEEAEIAELKGKEYVKLANLAEYNAFLTERAKTSGTTPRHSAEALAIPRHELISKLSSVEWYIGRLCGRLDNGYSRINSIVTENLTSAREAVAEVLTALRGASNDK